MTYIPNTLPNTSINTGNNVPVGGNTPTGNVANDPGLTVAYESLNFDSSDLNSLFDDTGNVNSQLLGDAVFKLDGLGKSSADIFTLMALMIQMGKEQREGARQVRDANNMLKQAELQEAADKMREAADMALAAGIVSGVFKMASGAVSIGGGVHGLKQLTKAGPGATNAQLDTVRNQGRIFDGSGQMVGSVGEMIAAGLTHASTNLSADQKEAEAASQMAETNAQREQEFMQNLQDMISKITSLLQDIQQQNNESLKRAASV
jgi:hypothetical protein